MMRRRDWLLSAVALGAAACSGNQGPKLTKATAGNLPDKGNWHGVWFSELYGNLHLKQSGNNLSGRWERPHKDRWGEISGTVTGDLYKFKWTEYTRGLVGPNSKKEGHGYFKYTRPEGENVDDKIIGEIGFGEDEVGDAWDAVKQRNVEPNPDSIEGTGSGDVGGGDWDKENQEGGKKPEGPKPPPPN